MYTNQMSETGRARIMARADAAGWHDGEDVKHEPMTLADAIVKAAGP